MFASIWDDAAWPASPVSSSLATLTTSRSAATVVLSTFLSDSDYALYRDLLGEHCRAAEVAVWAWCLMPNHVHLVLVPSDDDGLRRALAPVHRRYAGIIHARRRRTGHFWQGRFGAVVMDEEQLVVALAYVALNPVRARLVERARDWRSSSTRAHLARRGVSARRPAAGRCSLLRAAGRTPRHPRRWASAGRSRRSANTARHSICTARLNALSP
jgi:REP element-mobilizing transposase RayT